MKGIKIFSVFSIIFSFVIFSSISSHTIYAQSFFKIAADDGTPTQPGDNSSGSNDTIFIIAGVATAAIIGYVLYNKYHESKEDTTDESTASLKRLMKNEANSLENNIRKVKDEIPVNLMFSVGKPTATIPDRTYSVGLSFRF